MLSHLAVLRIFYINIIYPSLFSSFAVSGPLLCVTMPEEIDVVAIFYPKPDKTDEVSTFPISTGFSNILYDIAGRRLGPTSQTCQGQWARYSPVLFGPRAGEAGDPYCWTVWHIYESFCSLLPYSGSGDCRLYLLRFDSDTGIKLPLNRIWRPHIFANLHRAYRRCAESRLRQRWVIGSRCLSQERSCSSFPRLSSIYQAWTIP